MLLIVSIGRSIRALLGTYLDFAAWLWPVFVRLVELGKTLTHSMMEIHFSFILLISQI